MSYTILVKSLLKNAGEMALQYFQNVEAIKKDNKTYVTAADLAIQKYLKKEISYRFPNDGMIGEENNLRKLPRGGNTYWVIDPIDGTASFVRGFPTWGIAVAIVKNEKPYAGFFYMPVTGDFFSVELPTRHVLHNGRIVKMNQDNKLNRESVLLTVSGLHKRQLIDPSYKGKVRSLGTVTAHQCYVASGSADAVLLGRLAIWDLAVGMAMLSVNGGVFELLNSQSPLDMKSLLRGEKTPEPMLAGNKEIIKSYRSLISFRNS